MIPHDRDNGSDERIEDEDTSMKLKPSSLLASRNKGNNSGDRNETGSNDCAYSGQAEKRGSVSSACQKPVICNIREEQEAERNNSVVLLKDKQPPKTIVVATIQTKQDCDGVIHGDRDPEESVVSTTNSAEMDKPTTSMESQDLCIGQSLPSTKSSKDFLASADSTRTQSEDSIYDNDNDDDNDNDYDEEEDSNSNDDIDEAKDLSSLIADAEETNRKLRDRIGRLRQAIRSIRSMEAIKKGKGMVEEYGLRVEADALGEDLRFLEAKQEGLGETLFELHIQRLDLLRLEEDLQKERVREEAKERCAPTPYGKKNRTGRSRSRKNNRSRTRNRNRNRSSSFRRTVSNVSE